jgi:FkbM family methyltransferase
MFIYTIKNTNKIKSKYIKKVIIHFLFKIVNIPLLANISVDLKIGNTRLKTPLNHPSVFWSILYPIVNTNLSRLSSIISKEKYGSKFVDIGANVGDTWAILRSACPDNKILLIEGDAASYKWLKINTAEDLKSTLFNGFIGANDNNYVFLGSGNGSSGLLIQDDANKSNKELHSLDEVINLTKFENISLIKVDTDGFDTLIIRTGIQTLSKNKPLLFLEIQPYHLLRNDNFNEFLEFLISLRYKYLILWDSNGRFLCDIDIDNNKLISQLLPYFNGSPESLFLDIAFINEGDKLIKEKIVNTEINFTKKNFKSENIIPENIIDSFYRI